MTVPGNCAGSNLCSDQVLLSKNFHLRTDCRRKILRVGGGCQILILRGSVISGCHAPDGIRPGISCGPYSGTKKEHKPKLLSPDISGGVGVFHVKGWGPKSLVCPSKPGKSNFFGGISRRCPKSLRKKVCVQFLVPTYSLQMFRGLELKLDSNEALPTFANPRGR